MNPVVSPNRSRSSSLHRYKRSRGSSFYSGGGVPINTPSMVPSPNSPRGTTVTNRNKPAATTNTSMPPPHHSRGRHVHHGPTTTSHIAINADKRSMDPFLQPLTFRGTKLHYHQLFSHVQPSTHHSSDLTQPIHDAVSQPISNKQLSPLKAKRQALRTSFANTNHVPDPIQRLIELFNGGQLYREDSNNDNSQTHTLDAHSHTADDSSSLLATDDEAVDKAPSRHSSDDDIDITDRPRRRRKRRGSFRKILSPSKKHNSNTNSSVTPFMSSQNRGSHRTNKTQRYLLEWKLGCWWLWDFAWIRGVGSTSEFPSINNNLNSTNANAPDSNVAPPPPTKRSNSPTFARRAMNRHKHNSRKPKEKYQTQIQNETTDRLKRVRAGTSMVSEVKSNDYYREMAQSVFHIEEQEFFPDDSTQSDLIRPSRSKEKYPAYKILLGNQSVQQNESIEAPRASSQLGHFTSGLMRAKKVFKKSKNEEQKTEKMSDLQTPLTTHQEDFTFPSYQSNTEDDSPPSARQSKLPRSPSSRAILLDLALNGTLLDQLLGASAHGIPRHSKFGSGGGSITNWFESMANSGATSVGGSFLPPIHSSTTGGGGVSSGTAPMMFPNSMSSNGSNGGIGSPELTPEIFRFISQFGMIRPAREVKIFQGTKIATDFPHVPTVHVRLESWGDMILVSQLQKDHEWQKILKQRRNDRNSMYNESSELSLVTSRAMKEARDWKSNRLTRRMNPQEVNSLWGIPARKYEERIRRFNHRKYFFRKMVDRYNRGILSFPNRSGSSHSTDYSANLRALWGIYILREYMLREWDVNPRLYFHFCEVFGYQRNMHHRIEFFHESLEKETKTTIQELKRYKESMEDGRHVVLRLLKEKYNITEQSIEEFKESIHDLKQEFELSHGINSSGGITFLTDPARVPR